MAAWDGAQVTAALPSFEEVALKIVDSGDASALQIFLLTKPQVLGSQDKAQARLPHPPLSHPPRCNAPQIITLCP